MYAARIYWIQALSAPLCCLFLRILLGEPVQILGIRPHSDIYWACVCACVCLCVCAIRTSPLSQSLPRTLFNSPYFESSACKFGKGVIFWREPHKGDVSTYWLFMLDPTVIDWCARWFDFFLSRFSLFSLAGDPVLSREKAPIDSSVSFSSSSSSLAKSIVSSSSLSAASSWIIVVRAYCAELSVGKWITLFRAYACLCPCVYACIWWSVIISNAVF